MFTFQHNLPVFVKSSFTARGKEWKKGKHFPWLEMNMDTNKIQILFNQGFLHHNSELEKEIKTVGDGLDALGIEELHELVDNLNKIVKEKTKNKTEATKKKCAKSQIPDKQRGHIRRWRNLYGHLEND